VARILGRRLELEAVRANGRHFPVELTITEVKLGLRRLLAAHLRDLTAARLARAEIERQQETLHQTDSLPPIAVPASSAVFSTWPDSANSSAGGR
jgi:hypothetical protein